MKFGPKETKELNQYLRTGRNRNREFLTTELVDDLEPGALKDELLKDFDPSQETYEEYLQRKSLERPFNMADGGRIGFYKGRFVQSNPPGEQYVVKFASKSSSPGYPDKFVGTQKFATEEALNKAILDRKEFTKINIKKKPNVEKIAKEKRFKSIVDDVFKNKDFKNFKASVTDAQIKFARQRGKTRYDTGGKIPQQYLNEFNKAMKAGPGSDLFKNMMRITGRTEEQLLELDAKRPGGQVDPKIRAKRAFEFGGKEKQKTKEELLETQRKSQIKRAARLSEAKKFASIQDLMDINKINKGKKAINKFFKNNPEMINTTDFGKNIKAMMALRMDKEGKMFSRIMPDDYYFKKAKQGALFDIFDVTPVSKQTKNIRFPTNINLAPGQFNQAFIQGQVSKLFEKGVNKEALRNLENILKERNIRVELPNVGRIGAAPDVAVDRARGTFPRIIKTLQSMKAPESILRNFIDLTPIPGPLGRIKKLFADGGLSGSDKSGPPPERGPNSQGLLSLMKRGMKI
jgi:hypothetical protein